MMQSIDVKGPAPGYEEATAPPHQGASDTKVRLNVGGQKFTTWSSTLAKLPGTRLSGLTQEDPAYDREENEYFFDRNPWLFPYMLDAYRNGEVHFPESVCVPDIQAELLYWGLGKQLVPSCCWKTFSTWAEDQETSALVDGSLKPSSPIEAAGWRGKMNFVWRFLDDGHSSIFATIWLVFYTLLLILSLGAVIAWSCPQFKHYRIVNGTSGTGTLTEIDDIGNTPLRDINIVCTFFFFFELLIRFAVCPKKLRFIFGIFNIVDILHVIPMFIYCCVAISSSEEFSTIAVGAALMAISMFFRAVRVLKLATLSYMMKVLLLALRASAKELLMLLLIESVFTVAFASAVFFAEHKSEESHFRSIPDAMWWSIVTLTTVGYGDMRPIGAWGKFVGASCALTGIILLALAVSVVVNNLLRIHTNMKYRIRVTQRAIQKKVERVV